MHEEETLIGRLVPLQKKIDGMNVEGMKREFLLRMDFHNSRKELLRERDDLAKAIPDFWEQALLQSDIPGILYDAAENEPALFCSCTGTRYDGTSSTNNTTNNTTSTTTSTTTTSAGCTAESIRCPSCKRCARRAASGSPPRISEGRVMEYGWIEAIALEYREGFRHYVMVRARENAYFENKVLEKEFSPFNDGEGSKCTKIVWKTEGRPDNALFRFFLGEDGDNLVLFDALMDLYVNAVYYYTRQ